jgi:uncharacterized membrane protein YgcG
MRALIILAVALAAVAAAPSANAIMCYTLLDRNDNLLYRSPSPPVDMSAQGAALRDGLRRRNEYLMIADVDDCQPVAAVIGSSGYRPATVEEIVAGMRGYLSFGGPSSESGHVGSESMGGGGGGGGGGGAAAPAASGGARGRY